MSEKIGFAADYRHCYKCGETFMTNYYGNETICLSCKRKWRRTKKIVLFFKNVWSFIRYGD